MITYYGLRLSSEDSKAGKTIDFKRVPIEESEVREYVSPISPTSPKNSSTSYIEAVNVLGD